MTLNSRLTRMVLAWALTLVSIGCANAPGPGAVEERGGDTDGGVEGTDGGGSPDAGPSGCATTGDTTDISPVVISPSRTTGVAPLGVFFDTAGTLATAAGRPFHELDYHWDFDELNVDPGIGHWGDKGPRNGSSGTGANTSRRTDSGPVAAHVYEQPGSYRVRLTVRDVHGRSVTNDCVEISVQDPEVVFSGRTACFSNSADFTGCPESVPATARFTTSNLVNALAHDTTYKRLLFQRGHVFDAGSRVRMQAAGPGLVGAFGVGPAPKLRLTFDGNLFEMGGTSFSDWRMVDLDLDLNAPGPPVAADAHRALRSAGQMSDILLQRLWIHDGYHGYVIDGPADRMFFTDTTFENLLANTTNGQACYFSGHRLAYMGNRVDATRSHNSRFPSLSGAVLSHNHHSRPGGGMSNMKIPGPNFGDLPGTYSERVVVSSNRFVSGSADWMLELQPQSRHNDERLRDMIVERNHFEAASGFKTHAVSVSGSNLTLRNNIFDLSATTGAGAITVGRFGDCAVECEPLPENIDILHNTLYTSAGNSGSTLRLIEIRSSMAVPALPAAWGARVQNNLGYVPNQVPPQAPMLVVDLATGTIASNNSSDADLFQATPPLLSPTPSTAADFDLTAPTPMKGDGAVPVMSDFFGVARLKPAPPSVNDIGAAEF